MCTAKNVLYMVCSSVLSPVLCLHWGLEKYLPWVREDYCRFQRRSMPEERKDSMLCAWEHVTEIPYLV